MALISAAVDLRPLSVLCDALRFHKDEEGIMRVDPSRVPAVKITVAKSFPDERGFLLQSWVQQDLEAAGIPSDFKQAIQTFSKRGVVRGLHFQWDPPMGKLVRCISGAIIDVVVDVRHGSPTLGDHLAVELTGSNHSVIWVPPGFAHGTIALQDDSIVLYECTSVHGPGREGGILWNDPALGIQWPAIPPIVSDKDRAAPTLAAWLADPLSQAFQYESAPS
jgi:dTDP-4-dehydrorhamnose 3,5-epimerase